MLNKILGALGLNGVKWLGTDTKFWAMLFAFIFGRSRLLHADFYQWY